MSTYLIIGAAICYLPGFVWVFNKWMRDFNANHPMSHSSDYRMTDGYVTGAFASLLWPMMACGIILRKVVHSHRPNSKLANADDIEWMFIVIGGLMGLFIGLAILLLLVGLLASFFA